MFQWIKETARSTPFEPTGNNPADNVQEAIENSQTSGIGAIVPLPFHTAGNTADKWLGYASATAPSDEIPYVVPQNIDIKGLTFVNRDNDVDTNLLIYKNGSLIHTENIRNKRYYYAVGGNKGSALQGDRISVFLEKYVGGTGDSTAQDPLVILMIKFTGESAGTGGAQTGV